MATPKNKTQQQVTEEERERLDLFAAAEAEAGKDQQYSLDAEGDLKARKEFIDAQASTIGDPEEKYRIYYDGIQKLLIENLPKGKTFKKARDYIYDEKNIFLTRGKAKDAKGKRHGDGRMTYQPDMQQMLDEVIAWILSRGTMTDLYNRLWQLNERMGYPHQSNFVVKVP